MKFLSPIARPYTRTRRDAGPVFSFFIGRSICCIEWNFGGHPLSKSDLGHHSLISMVQEMAMEERGTPDDGIGEIITRSTTPPRR